MIPLAKEFRDGKRRDGKRKDTLLGMLSGCARVGCDLHPDDSDASSCIYDAHAILQHLSCFFPARVFVAACLIAYCVDRAVYTFDLLFPRTQSLLDPLALLPQCKNLFDGIPLTEVDRNSARFFGFRQPFRNAIDNLNLRGSF